MADACASKCSSPQADRKKLKSPPFFVRLRPLSTSEFQTLAWLQHGRAVIPVPGVRNGPTAANGHADRARSVLANLGSRDKHVPITKRRRDSLQLVRETLCGAG